MAPQEHAHVTAPRKKLIEVSLPLEAINAASAREKSIRHGHPSTLHLGWARRPLAACRAVLFAQLVDDPSAWPEVFPTEEAQDRERERLHRVVAEMVRWEAGSDEHVMGKARYEIAASLARGRGEAPPGRGDAAGVLAYLAERAPPVCDPFCGGGSIPLEAQRLGLRARGSDLNPVAVLVSRATCEIPPKFADRPPVNPGADPHAAWRGARGLAEDVRHYGGWMREQARERIGHLYPRAGLADGSEATVIAWLWARTVASPDPMMRGAHVPLVRSFVLSSKKGKRAWVEPVVDPSGRAWRFTVRSGSGTPPEGTVGRRGGRCLLTGAPMPFEHIRSEGRAGRMDQRLMAVVAEGKRGRVYLEPTAEMEEVARQAEPAWRPDGKLPDKALGFRIQQYGMHDYADLFTPRQLVALATFSDLVAEARERVKLDAGAGEAYADAVATYLGLCVSRQANRCSNLNFWDPGGEKVQQVFARQALPMVWDFCEANPFSDSSGNFVGQVDYLANVVAAAPPAAVPAVIIQRDAARDPGLADDAVVATDPPYYDNIGYADLSDFFYVWLRRALAGVHPDLFRRVLTPKDEELVATPYRHGGREEAERFFMDGVGRALRNMHKAGAEDFPVTIYYAFKQSEVASEGLTSPGWATFLQGVFEAGYVIDGTWPVRTELPGALKKRMNALASSIVLACRKREAGAPTITRREFVARLRAELPAALRRIRAGGVGPVDVAQAALGPGMGVFTACARVLEPDDAPMTVRAAIALINQVRDEISGEEASGYDPETRFCIDWFEAFGMAEGESGDAITMAQAYGLGIEALVDAGAFAARGGAARLLGRGELPADWDPAADRHLIHWECAQHLARVLEAPGGGSEAAARLLTAMGPDAGEAARLLAFRLYDICEREDRAAEAQVWNMLVREWPSVEAAAQRAETGLREAALPFGEPGGA